MQFITALLGDRPLDRLRSAQGVLRLAQRYGAARLEAACARAAAVGEHRSHTVKSILAAGLDRQPLPSLAPDVIHERYERGSIVLTSNRDRAEWTDLFGDPLSASAALDRLTHGAHFVEITGPSFRAHQTRKQLAAGRASKASK